MTGLQMPKKEKTFSAGELLYKQGQPCSFVFTVVSGTAELFYEENGKKHVLGRKGKNGLLGEKNVLDGTYDCNARALTDLVVTVQNAEEYIEFLQRSGELTPHVFQKKVDFAQQDDVAFDFSFDDEVEKQQPEKTVLKAQKERKSKLVPFQSDKSGFNSQALPDEMSSALVRVEKRARDLTVREPSVLPAEIKRHKIKKWLYGFTDGKNTAEPVILLASVSSDEKNRIRNELYMVLSEISGLRVKVVDKAVDDRDLKRGTLQIRSWLDQHDADTGIYAFLNDTGGTLEIRSVGALSGSDTGVAMSGFRFFLPVEMNDEQKALLKIFAVCALTPQCSEQEKLLHLLLPSLLNEVADYASKPMSGLSKEEQAVNLIAFGNVLTWTGLMNYAQNRQDQAREVYERALMLLPAHASEYVFVSRQVGFLRQIQGERNESLEAFKIAEETFQKGLRAVSEENQPEIYGDLNLRIGNVRQRIALQTGKGRDFVLAMTSYRNALKTLTPQSHIQYWADAMNGLARTMQLFSSYGSKTVLLKKSVGLYEKELCFLDEKSHPLLWARACNNMASALFWLADRQGTDSGLLRRAVEVFSDALRVYRQTGAIRMANVAGDNLKYVEDVLAQMENATSSFDKVPDGNGNAKDNAGRETSLTFEKIHLLEDLEEGD